MEKIFDEIKNVINNHGESMPKPPKNNPIDLPEDEFEEYLAKEERRVRICKAKGLPIAYTLFDLHLSSGINLTTLYEQASLGKIPYRKPGKLIKLTIEDIQGYYDIHREIKPVTFRELEESEGHNSALKEFDNIIQKKVDKKYPIKD